MAKRKGTSTTTRTCTAIAAPSKTGAMSSSEDELDVLPPSTRSGKSMRAFGAALDAGANAKQRAAQQHRAQSPESDAEDDADEEEEDVAQAKPSRRAPKVNSKSAKALKSSSSSIGAKTSSSSKKSKSSSKSSSKRTRTKAPRSDDEVEEEEEDDFEDVDEQQPSSEPQPMPEAVIQTYLENFDMEAEQRLRNARQRLADALNAARNQMQVYIRQIPRAARVLRVSEFVDEYGAEVQAVISQTATRATREVRGADADAYDAAKAAVAGKKRKDEGEERGEKAKSARRGDSAAAAAAATSSKPKLSRTNTSSRVAAAKAKFDGNANEAGNSTPRRATGESVQPYTSATFAPRLNPPSTFRRSSRAPQLPATPNGGKPRAARAGEKIQWQSINGSPITGVIGPDGVVRPLPASSARPKTKLNTASTQYGDDEDIEDSLSKLAKGLDAGYPKRKSGETVEGWYESSSRLVPTSDALDDEDELPDEEALTAQVLAEESQRRARLASNGSARGPPVAGGRGKMREQMPSSSSSNGEPSGRPRAQQRVSIMLGDGAVRPVAKLTAEDLKQINPEERDRLFDLLKAMTLES